MLAIETLYHGPTNTRGSRITARVMESGKVRRVTIPYDDGKNTEDAHTAAAIALIQKLGWTQCQGYGPWIRGSSVRGYVFTCDTKYNTSKVQVYS